MTMIFTVSPSCFSTRQALVISGYETCGMVCISVQTCISKKNNETENARKEQTTSFDIIQTCKHVFFPSRRDLTWWASWIPWKGSECETQWLQTSVPQYRVWGGLQSSTLPPYLPHLSWAERSRVWSRDMTKSCPNALKQIDKVFRNKFPTSKL